MATLVWFVTQEFSPMKKFCYSDRSPNFFKGQCTYGNFFSWRGDQNNGEKWFFIICQTFESPTQTNLTLPKMRHGIFKLWWIFHMVNVFRSRISFRLIARNFAKCWIEYSLQEKFIISMTYRNIFHSFVFRQFDIF